MERIEFEEQKQSCNTDVQKIAFLPSLLIRYSRGKIETEKQANLILLVISGIIFLLAIFFGSRSSTPNVKIPDSVTNTFAEHIKIPVNTKK